MDVGQLDILAFGAHPDDVEIGMGGSIAKYAAEGKKIGICDLTKAELSSNGTVENRRMEASKAADILGVVIRETLDLPDRGLFLLEDHIRQVAAVIRRYQPKVVFAPYFDDRHPDHGNCTKIVEEAVFSAGIKKYDAGDGFPPHRVRAVYFYMINSFIRPDFCIDISKFIDKKIAGLSAYRSQFERNSESFETPLVNGYLESVKARESLFGKEAGVSFAEGFKTKKPILVHFDLLGVE